MTSRVFAPSALPILAVLVPLFLAAPLAAQVESCPVDSTSSARICQAGADALTLFLPLEGVLVGGGNPVPGTAGALGKFGKFRLAARVGFATATLPSTSYDGVSDTVQADKRLLIPVPRLDLSIGLLSKKLALGTASIDLLGSTVLLPTGVSTRYRVDQNARKIGSIALGLGFGVRAALVMPAPKPMVSLSVIKRDLPTLRFGDLAAGDQLSIATNLSAINVRLMVGGKVKFLTLAAGAGMDLLKGAGSVSWHDSTSATDSTIAVKLSTSRIITTLNAAFELGPISLWGEGGYQLGGKEKLTTIFERVDPASGRFYGGAGIALRF
ncbi:MAG: hypothetical protein ABI587_08080 [Gemmatimonadales bacterium]